MSYGEAPKTEIDPTKNIDPAKFSSVLSPSDRQREGVNVKHFNDCVYNPCKGDYTPPPQEKDYYPSENNEFSDG